MTHLTNDPDGFAAQSLAGFVAAHPDHVASVPGGVVGNPLRGRGLVSVIMGGGSGHFPAFAGWVGPGFGHGAACGNVFASPSERQILSVTRAAGTAGGVLFVPINYAGDILHFGAAADTLRAEGVDVRMVAVTDDIASAGTHERLRRRGIAGSFIVLKMIGAAAARGASLDDVERIAVAANDATRTLGAAFSGCTLPGAGAPLFSVDPGRMAVGLGIHGEPGIDDVALGSADDATDVILDRLFEERPVEAGRRVALLVNGLGGTSPDELHLVFARANDRLTRAGMTVVAPVVGSHVTSYDMAGFSVSITYLDDELEELWLEPAHSATFSRGEHSGSIGHAEASVPPATSPAPPEVLAQAPGSVDSQRAAIVLAAELRQAAEVVDENSDELGRLDAVGGDGDHGIGMSRGIRAAATAAAAAADRGAGVGTTLRVAAMEWSDIGGGTSGALWGAGLEAAGSTLGDEKAPTTHEVLAAVQAFTKAIVTRGGANAGDKTMVDALLPFEQVLSSALTLNQDGEDAWNQAAQAAAEAAERTSELTARIGRSRTHGDRTLGTPDPGAISFALIAQSHSRASGRHNGIGSA